MGGRAESHAVFYLLMSTHAEGWGWGGRLTCSCSSGLARAYSWGSAGSLLGGPCISGGGGDPLSNPQDERGLESQEEREVFLITVNGRHMSEVTDGFCLRVAETGNQSSSGEAGDESPDSGGEAGGVSCINPRWQLFNTHDHDLAMTLEQIQRRQCCPLILKAKVSTGILCYMILHRYCIFLLQIEGLWQSCV